MQSILVVGVETVVGANFVAHLQDRVRVVGVRNEPEKSHRTHTSAIHPGTELDRARRLLATWCPDQIVYCGPAAESSWQCTAGRADTKSLSQDAKAWAVAAVEAGCRLTVISSDAVFTGPRMFHDENSSCLCPSPSALGIRRMEDEVLRTAPQSLIIRTNCFGWSPSDDNSGWVERLLQSLSEESALPNDCTRYAAPLSAADVVDLWERGTAAGINGIYHVAGAERINPFQFARKLAARFRLSVPAAPSRTILAERPCGFACGETALNSLKIRRLLDVSVPMVEDGIHRLFEQSQSGYRDQLRVAVSSSHDMVA